MDAYREGGSSPGLYITSATHKNKNDPWFSERLSNKHQLDDHCNKVRNITSPRTYRVMAGWITAATLAACPPMETHIGEVKNTSEREANFIPF